MSYQYILVLCCIAAGFSVCLCDKRAVFLRSWSGSSWTDCSTSASAKVTSLQISPSPLLKGSSATVEITLGLSEEIQGGAASIVIKYKDMVPVKSTTVDICKLGEDGCPFQTGTHTLTFTTKLPSYTLSGKYTGRVKAFDQDEKELLCIKIYGIYVK